MYVYLISAVPFSEEHKDNIFQMHQWFYHGSNYKRCDTLQMVLLETFIKRFEVSQKQKKKWSDKLFSKMMYSTQFSSGYLKIRNVSIETWEHFSHLCASCPPIKLLDGKEVEEARYLPLTPEQVWVGCLASNLPSQSPQRKDGFLVKHTRRVLHLVSCSVQCPIPILPNIFTLNWFGK